MTTMLTMAVLLLGIGRSAIPPVSTQDCSTVLCIRPICDPSLIFTPPGECCPQCRCPRNFQFKTCATCNSTCDNPRPFCTRECKPPQCNCLPPNAIDASGNCIRASSCPSTTKPPVTTSTIDCRLVRCARPECDEELWIKPPGACCSVCPSTTAPPKLCDDPNEKFFQFGPCISPCGSAPCTFAQAGPPGCYCKDPINMRLLNGKCVFVKDCPKPCLDRNAEYLPLGLVARRQCIQPFPSPITKGMKPRPGCYCKRGFVLGRFNRCVPISSCNTCTRSSYFQQTKDLTRYSSCIPAAIDVGTCRGTCAPISFFPSRICRLCDVAAYATQQIRCRNFVGAQVLVNIDIVKSCGCRNVVSYPTGIIVPRPTRRPTRRPVSVGTLSP